MTINMPLYLLTIGVTSAFTIFLIYFFNRIKRENKERAKIIHVPEAFDKLFVEIDKRHTKLRSHITQNKDQLLLQETIEEYEALINKYKNKIYECRDNIQNENSTT